MYQLHIEPLTSQAFAVFGDVIETEGAEQFPINNGSTTRFHDLAKIDTKNGEGRTIVSIFRAQPLVYPLAVRMMERHPLGSQAFIPRGKQAFLVLVAPAGERFAKEQLRVFLATEGQGVNYHKGVWHHPVLALEPDQDFIVIDRGGAGQNCDEYYFPQDMDICLCEV